MPIPPIRNAQAVAVDQQALSRPFLHSPIHTVEAVEFFVIKKTGLGHFSLREKLVFHKVTHIQPRPSSVFNGFNRISPYPVVDLAHVERGRYFLLLTRKISIS